MNAPNIDGCPGIGFVDVGGPLVPRAELARMLPDIERFEHHLADTQALARSMDENGGRVPDYVTAWSLAKRRAVVVTMEELAKVQRALADDLRARRRAQGGEHA